MTRRDKEKERKREREFPRGKFERLANGLSKLIYRKKKKKRRGERKGGKKTGSPRQKYD